ncbi:MAG TPA: YafY family protein [Polyangia bacterium]|nr:YafY family protein [Polyangia bacterium]
MRRADRLFQIVQRLRGRAPVTAATLARELEVSARTIYRDVQDLVLSGVPIQGEAGVGYALPRSFDLPPLMFDEAEIEALVLGARIVESWADAELARAARNVLSKVEVVLPPRLRDRIPDAALFAPGFHVRKATSEGLSELRAAIKARRKVALAYRDRGDAATERTVQPLGVFYWGASWSLGAWCELRRDFRNFRLDRVTKLEVTAQTFADEPGRTLRDFFRHYEEEDRRPGASRSST